MKYREIGDFHEYYSGKRTAPYLTIFIGGNHEASNHMFELYYGGWAAPNIYYLGAANVLRFGPLRIAGLSGIWKGYDYNKPHFERLPYNFDDLKSVFHVRELDVRKLMQIRTQVDVGLSHDWPRGIERHGDYRRLRHDLREDSEAGQLGSVAAKHVLDRLRPPHWFSAHLHVRYAAVLQHGEYVHPRKSRTGNKQPVSLSKGLDGSSDQIPSTRFDIQNKDSSALLAWNNFPNAAAKQDAADRETFLQNQSQPEENNSLDLNSISCTWRQIDANDSTRKVVAVEESHPAEERPVVKNTDEIDLDLDSDGEDACGAQSKNPDEMDTKVEMTSQTEKTSQPHQELDPVRTELIEASGGVPEALREQLPEGFKRGEPEPAVYGPLPETISNKETQFLALGKCQEGRNCHDFLELLEIQPTPNEGDIKRPYSLQYDPEWLAITRALEHNLVLGDPKSQVPPDKGDETYKAEIAAEEVWVHDNIVKKGKLTIPGNFEMTAPEYDPEVPVDVKDMPPEYNNPQTAAFCELLGIPNKFHLTPVEREQRIAAGPRPARPGNSGWKSHRGRGGRGGRSRGGARGGRGRGGFRPRQGLPF